MSPQDKIAEQDLSYFEQRVKELPSQYAVIGKASVGGMGAIYKARNRYTRRDCAIKVMREEIVRDEGKLLRFRIEAEAASKLRHPHICAVHDFGITESSVPYLVMDWVDGTTLEERLRADGPLSVKETQELFLQLTSAIAHAHEQKVVHRDLKPANIMLAKTENPEQIDARVVDFGLAKLLDDGDSVLNLDGLTKTGTVVGSPMYMSPEQARGVPIDARSDVYSLGCVLYAAVTGDAPFASTTAVDTLYSHIHLDPPEIDPKLKIPADLKHIMLKAMQKKPEDRYQSMEAMNADLKQFIEGIPLTTGTLASQRRQWLRRAKFAALFIASFVVVYLGSLVIQDFLDKVNPEQAPTATPTQR